MFQEDVVASTSQEESNLETEIDWALRVGNTGVLDHLLSEKLILLDFPAPGWSPYQSLFLRYKLEKGLRAV